MKQMKNILIGVLLVVLGVIWAGNALDLFYINVFFAGWWTLFLIVPSFYGMLVDRNKVGHAIVLFIGILLLLCAQDVISFTLIRKLFIPVALIGIGFSLLYREAFEGHKANNSLRDLGDCEDVYTVFFGEKKVSATDKFTSARVEADFGSLTLDLTQAKLKGENYLRVNAIFGGVQIVVPAHVQVKTISSSFFGVVQNERKQAMASDDKVLYVEVHSLFGSVHIL